MSTKTGDETTGTPIACNCESCRGYCVGCDCPKHRANPSTGTQELREAVRKMINGRPYYICKSGNGDHKDLQSQIGSMIGQYSRREDKLNEEYLEREIIALINTRIAAVLDRALEQAITVHGIEHANGVEVFNDGLDAVPIEVIQALRKEVSE